MAAYDSDARSDSWRLEAVARGAGRRIACGGGLAGSCAHRAHRGQDRAFRQCGEPAAVRIRASHERSRTGTAHRPEVPDGVRGRILVREPVPGTDDPGETSLPCEHWQATRRGFRYRDAAGSAAGVQEIATSAGRDPPGGHVLRDRRSLSRFSRDVRGDPAEPEPVAPCPLSSCFRPRRRRQVARLALGVLRGIIPAALRQPSVGVAARSPSPQDSTRRDCCARPWRRPRRRPRRPRSASASSLWRPSSRRGPPVRSPASRA